MSSPVTKHLHEIFCFKLVWPKEPIWAPDYPPKVFSILSSNSPRYSNFRAFRVLSELGNFPAVYYQNTEIFIPRIISICTISFPVLSANAKFFLKWKIHSAYSQYKLNSFLGFSLYAKFLSLYSSYEFNFFLRIISIRTMSFSVFSANAKFFWDKCLILSINSMGLISFRVLSV